MREAVGNEFGRVGEAWVGGAGYARVPLDNGTEAPPPAWPPDNTLQLSNGAQTIQRTREESSRRSQLSAETLHRADTYGAVGEREGNGDGVRCAMSRAQPLRLLRPLAVLF